MNVFWGLLIPFLGTTLGSACVFFMKKELNPFVQKGFLGFAAGVMVAASVCQNGGICFCPSYIWISGGNWISAFYGQTCATLTSGQ